MAAPVIAHEPMAAPAACDQSALADPQQGARDMRDSHEVKAMIAGHFAQQLLAVSTDAGSMIAIDELPLARIKRSMPPPDKTKALVPHATSPDAPRSVSC